MGAELLSITGPARTLGPATLNKLCQKLAYPMYSVLFLDFDVSICSEGACHIEGGPAPGARDTKPFGYADLLADLVAPYPELRIVLTKSSVSGHGLTSDKETFAKSLQDKVIGAIHQFSDGSPEWAELSTFELITRYVNRYGIRSWLAFSYDCGSWHDDFQEHLICLNSHHGLGELAVQDDIAKKLELLHCQEFRRITVQHNWTQDLLAARREMAAAVQVLADTTSFSNDVARFQAAAAVVVSCSNAISYAQSCRVGRVYGREGLLVAFLGNALDWDRDKRSAVLRLLDYDPTDSQSMATTPSEAAIEALGLAKLTLEECRRWLATEWRML